MVAIFLCAMVSHLFSCLWRNLECSGILFAVKIMQGLSLLILTQSHHLSLVLMTNIKTGYHIRYSCINKVIPFQQEVILLKGNRRQKSA